MEGREKIVIDASMVTKWYSKEENTDKAVQYKTMYVIGEIELVAPSLLIYEVANALNYKPDFAQRDLKISIEALIDLSLSIKPPTKELMEKAVLISRKYGLSIYDSVYVALAENLNSKLITADKKLLERIKGHPLVQLLDE